MKISSNNVFNSKVEHWLGNKNQTLLQHIEPSGLSFDISFKAGLSLLGFEVSSRLNETDVCGNMQ